MTNGVESDIPAAMAEGLSRLDLDSLRKEFTDQGQFIAVENFLPDMVLARLRAELERLRPEIHRVRVPGRKGGSVSRFSLDRLAPAFHEVYGAPAFVDWLGRLSGERLLSCPDADPHAYALYWYAEPGDFITYHYDTSFYLGKRFTGLLGLEDRSTSQLVYQLHRKDRGRQVEERGMSVRPGDFVFFDGDRLYHKITPLGAGEERIVLTLEWVTDPRMRRWHRFISNMKDSISYFGFRQVYGSGEH